MPKVIYMQHNSPEWHAYRRNGIGASEAASALGKSPWLTNMELWEQKTGKREPADLSGVPAVEYGIAVEEALAKIFALDFPYYEVIDSKQEVYVHSNGFMFASLDSVLKHTPTGQMGVLECKSANIQSMTARASWENKIPDQYYIQVLHQLATTGFSFCFVAALLRETEQDKPKNTIRYYKFLAEERQRDIDYLVAEEAKFWEFVTSGKRPPYKIKDF